MKPLLLALLLASCAAPEARLLTVEQDSMAAEACRGGCVIVPGGAWAQIKIIIKACGGVEI